MKTQGLIVAFTLAAQVWGLAIPQQQRSDPTTDPIYMANVYEEVPGRENVDQIIGRVTPVAADWNRPRPKADYVRIVLALKAPSRYTVLAYHVVDVPVGTVQGTVATWKGVQLTTNQEYQSAEIQYWPDENDRTVYCKLVKPHGKGIRKLQDSKGQTMVISNKQYGTLDFGEFGDVSPIRQILCHSPAAVAETSSQ